MTSTRKPRAAQLGVTPDEYDRMLAAQGGGCAICGNPPKTRRLDVDHDHRTKAVRGLLCHRCNRYLPPWATSDWCRAAADYLQFGYPTWGSSWLSMRPKPDHGADRVDPDHGADRADRLLNADPWRKTRERMQREGR